VKGAKTNPLHDQENEHRSAALRFGFSALSDAALGQNEALPREAHRLRPNVARL
jgi:hypothetical protein